MGIELAKYPKRFVYNNYTWKIENMDGLNKYLDEKIDEFKACYQKEGEKSFKKNLIKEFFEIYDYDCTNSSITVEEGTKIDNKENKNLLVNEMTFVLGNVFLGTHYEIVHRKMNYQTLNILNRVINYNELYYEALNSYFLNLIGVRMPEIIDLDKSIYGLIPKEQLEIIKMSHRHCILTTYAMLPLIEYLLCEKLASIMMYNSIKKMFYKLSKREISLSAEDLNLFSKFNFNLYESKAYTYKENELDELYSKLTFYGVLKDDMANKEILTRHKWDKKGKKLGKVMLGDLLENSFFEQKCEPEYFKIFKIIFGRRNLNLRNNIMHGTGSYFDYFNITFTSILVQLCWDIINNHVFVDNAIDII